MGLDYEKLHWGDAPDRDTSMVGLTGPCRVEGQIAAVSYVTSKAGKPEVYRHEFDEHNGRRPYLLRKGAGGRRLNAALPSESIAIGRLVDLELTDGRRFIGGTAWIATDEGGEDVWLVAPEPVNFAIEPRPDGHFVTERGMEE